MDKQYWATYFLGFLFLCLTAFSVSAQSDATVIRLQNPSFEGIAGAEHGVAPATQGWYDCGRNNFPKETPPDLHPNPIAPLFGVTKPAQEGETYLGMVVRDNDTWESVSQRLSTPIMVGNCYDFSLYLARAEDYISPVGNRDSNVELNRSYGTEVNHNTPTVLRIWGGNGYCNKADLLVETSEITHERWIQYNYKLEPQKNATYLTFEVFYKTPTPFPYNGNLLIDNLSELRQVPCQEAPPTLAFTNPTKNNKKVTERVFTFRATTTHILKKEDIQVVFNGNPEDEFYFDERNGGIAVPQRLQKGENMLEIQVKNSAGEAVAKKSVFYEEPSVVTTTPNNPLTTEPVATTPSKPKLLERSEFKRGKTIRIDKLYFPADSTNIKEESYEALDEVFGFLKENPDVIVEVGGHTNGVPSHDYCNRLSSERAKAVALYLVQKGIDAERLKYKGYGKTKPIATNDTMEGRRKNQRVEIKILSFDG